MSNPRRLRYSVTLLQLSQAALLALISMQPISIHNHGKNERGGIMQDPMKDPRFWRDRAEETRTRAESFRVAEAEKQRLLKIAEEYEQLAVRAEQWRTVSGAERRE